MEEVTRGVSTNWLLNQLYKELEKRGRMTEKQLLNIIPKEVKTGLVLPTGFQARRMKFGGRIYFVSERYYKDYYKNPTADFWGRTR